MTTETIVKPDRRALLLAARTRVATQIDAINDALRVAQPWDAEALRDSLRVAQAQLRSVDNILAYRFPEGTS